MRKSTLLCALAIAGSFALAAPTSALSATSKIDNGYGATYTKMSIGITALSEGFGLGVKSKIAIKEIGGLKESPGAGPKEGWIGAKHNGGTLQETGNITRLSIAPADIADTTAYYVLPRMRASH